MKYSCQCCARSDLSLTANGRVRSHAADGRRAGPTNPHCPGGSDFPIENTEFHTHVFEYDPEGDDGEGIDGSFCTVGNCTLAEPEDEAPANPRPTQLDVDNADRVLADPNATDDAMGQAEHVLQRADEHGIRPNFPQPNPHRAPLPRGRLEEQENGSSVTSALSSAEKTGAPTTGPSSGPTTTASAPSAAAPSSKETTSVASEKASSSTVTASKPGSPKADPNSATSFVNGPVGTPAKSNAVPRDRWGRYILPHPETGRSQPWTRATTLAGSVADTFALSMWSQRMVAKGITLRPDLYALASSFDVSADKDDMNAVCDQAKSAAGDKVAANLGTAMHAFTAAVDSGEKPNVPPTMQADVDAYTAALHEIGLEIVPYMIERRTCITSLKEDVAGTFDRVYRVIQDIMIKVGWSKKSIVLHAGDYVIGDLKTGRDLAYGWGEIAIQESLYAHGINDHGVWNADAEEWEIPHSLEDVNTSLTVRADVGIVVHLPIQKTSGKPACVVYAVNIADGWEATQLCTAVRQWRKNKQLATAMEVVDSPETGTRELNAHGSGSGYAGHAPVSETGEKPSAPAQAHVSPTAAQVADHPSVVAGRTTPVVRRPTWEERAASISTKADASEIFQEMKKDYQKIGATRVNAVVKIMQDRLRSLVENAG